jgi:hypothetical protein
MAANGTPAYAAEIGCGLVLKKTYPVDDTGEHVGDQVRPAPLRAVASGQYDQLGVVDEARRHQLVGQAVLRASDVGGRKLTPGSSRDRLAARGGNLRAQ